MEIICAARCVANIPGIYHILGDFNVPYINWRADACSVSNGLSNKPLEAVEEELPRSPGLGKATTLRFSTWHAQHTRTGSVTGGQTSAFAKQKARNSKHNEAATDTDLFLNAQREHANAFRGLNPDTVGRDRRNMLLFAF